MSVCGSQQTQVKGLQDPPHSSRTHHHRTGSLRDTMKAQIYLLAFAASIIVPTRADVYLHNPRGSNNRLDENKRPRNNANRLFDSQNNERGGYNVGGLYYFSGSKLDVEWTNQHSCGNANNHCELILQYMCGDNVRDGTKTGTIPENKNGGEDTSFGMHEDYEYYVKCKTRERNKGLYLINQKLKGDTAKYTRQNPGGTRRGYECPEERDYYPYWHPAPWIDVAVMTNDVRRCPYYQAESHNVKERWACHMAGGIKPGHATVPNTRKACQSAGGTWTLYEALGGGPPECRETSYSRDNHLGNGLGGYPNTYTWTIPNTPHEHCVLRLRYNISTADYDAWDNMNATHNDNNDKTRLDLSDRYNLGDRATAESRGYRLVNNPQVQIFPELTKVKLQLAINTAQYGRTFQDRSHVFAIRTPDASYSETTIYNVNVRGKRGNIVQVYPAVEYDFVPNTLKMGLTDAVHFQWTGSNNNPGNNDGQGKAGTDRSNVVLQRTQAYPEGTPSGNKFGHWGRSYPAYVANTSFLGFSQQDRLDLAFLTSHQLGGNMAELDDTGTYFDLGPRKVTKKGVFHYMCTRNNNFSNRSQKGRLMCQESKVASGYIGWNGGEVETTTGDKKVALSVPRGTFATLKMVEIEQWSIPQAKQMMAEKGRQNPLGGTYSSLFLVIKPETKLAVEQKTFEVEMSVEKSGATVYRTTQDFNTWTRVDSVSMQDGMARFQAQEGGVYVAVSHSNFGTIIGAVVAALVVVGLLIGGVILYRKKQPATTNICIRSCQKQV